MLVTAPIKNTMVMVVCRLAQAWDLHTFILLRLTLRLPGKSTLSVVHTCQCMVIAYGMWFFTNVNPAAGVVLESLHEEMHITYVVDEDDHCF